MPDPLAICLEDLDLPPENERYLRCVALPGAEPGLSLDRAGKVRWLHQGPEGCELWVSADGRLALERAPSSAPVTVRRVGRSLDAPAGKPVLLQDQDLLEVAGRRLQIHVHGAAEEVHAPEPLSTSALSRMARAAAAAVALGSLVGAGGQATAQPGEAIGGAPIEVRARPPKVMRRIPRICTIKGHKKGKKGTYQITLTCPSEAQMSVGKQGKILDADGANLPNGDVTVTKIKGTTVTASTTLDKEKLGKAKKARFYTR